MTAEIGVRELKQHASRVIARVQSGESIVVTVRGRPAARLLPIRPVGRLEELVEEGRARPARVAPSELPPALDPVGQGPSLSEALAELREAERW